MLSPASLEQFLDKRPVFQDLLRSIDERGDIDYVIIYARSRVFRNCIEAAVVKQQPDKRGVKLISANPNEDFGDGYWAEAMEAITDVFNWVQVRQSGDDIKKKMLHKAQNGGTEDDVVGGLARLGEVQGVGAAVAARSEFEQVRGAPTLRSDPLDGEAAGPRPPLVTRRGHGSGRTSLAGSIRMDSPAH
jgi:resolvase-like protein